MIEVFTQKTNKIFNKTSKGKEREKKLSHLLFDSRGTDDSTADGTIL